MDKNELQKGNLDQLPAIFGMNKKETKLYKEDLKETKEELLKEGSKELDKNPNLTTDELALKFAKFERDKTKKFSFKRKILNIAIKEMEKKNETNN
ncbi:hypothetical protein [Mammaliicoccus sciuri]|uniref:hypothetical protein n=1 Tax=Mammaliicoccus sciuri TaxID=1296 RepID=UPI001FB1A850|nr:hypothetical protein [Mammaliicoccus sciuri]MCJ1783069.1 hypothetical protein [Mammaliicoccus sciuri]